MWFWGLVALTVGTLAACHILGRYAIQAARWAPSELEGRYWPAPLLGLAILLLLSSYLGKLGFTFTTSLCLLISLSLILAAVWLQKQRRRLPAEVALLALFGVITALPFYFGILKFGGYNPYNDVYTYLVHAQWLQNNGFLETARLSGFYPGETQVVFYQEQGLRFGASFLFALLQAAYDLRWSYQIYPLAVTLPSAVLGLAIAALARSLALDQKRIPFVAGLLPAVTLSGFAHGVLWGFMPQAYGLALAVGGMVFLVGSGEEEAGKLPWQSHLPSALCFAAVGYSYSEIFPFVVVSVAAYFAFRFLRNEARRREVLRNASILAVAVLVLLNTEAVRIVRALLVQAGARVGMPVDWSPTQFLAHAAGFLTADGDGARSLLGNPFLTILVCVGIGLLVTVLLIRFLDPRDHAKLFPFYALLVLMGLAFVYFRLLSTSPWPVGVGQSWNQFKLSNWASPVLFVLIAVALARWAARWKTAEFPILIGLSLWAAGGLTVHYQLSEGRTRDLRQFTGYEQDPFQAYLGLRQLVEASTDPDEVIYLDLGGTNHKNRQLVTYFIDNRKLAGDWEDDGYFWRLPKEEKRISKDRADWIIFPGASAPKRFSAWGMGNFVLRSLDSSYFLEDRVGGYEIENHEDGWCVWTANTLAFRFSLVERAPSYFRVRFRYLAAHPGQRVKMTVKQRDGAPVEYWIGMTGVWDQYESPPIPSSGTDVEVSFSSPAPARRIAEGDSRLLSFAIKNLKLEPSGRLM